MKNLTPKAIAYRTKMIKENPELEKFMGDKDKLSVINAMAQAFCDSDTK